MATLVSPGVSITVSDESFYSPAGSGTVPLIVIATAQDKKGPDGSSTAGYTVQAKANKLYQITSQRELLQNYGNPNFKVSSGSPVHGDETNEYGLMAAYSFLGIANRAYVLRANVDLSQLESSSSAPSSKPANGSYWLNSGTTVWGMKKYDGANWVSESSNIIVTGSSDLQANGIPKPAFAKNDEICVRYLDADGTQADRISFYQKKSNVWYLMGSSAWDSASSKDFQFASHLAVPSTRSDSSALQTGDFYLQTTTPNNGSSVDLKEYDSANGQFVAEGVVLRQFSSTAYNVYGSNLVKGSIWGDHDGENTEAEIVLKAHDGDTTVTLESSAAIADNAISNTKANASSIAFNIFANASTTAIPVFLTSETSGSLSVDDIVADIQSALSGANVTLTNADQIVASNNAGKVKLVNSQGRDIRLSEGPSSFALSDINLSATTASNWVDISYSAQSSAPVGAVKNGQLWYDADISTTNIDMLEHNGSAWVTLTKDFQTKATEPTLQSDNGSLVTGDIWLNSSDTENIRFYRYNATSSKWVLIDDTDQSSADGIVFADFRSVKGGSLDADSPSAALYPSGILGFNLRASGGGVRCYKSSYDYGGNTPLSNVWVSVSGTKSDGSAYFLRKAQRKAVVVELQAAITSNQEIRNEINRFNIAAVPGYPELADELLTLGVDRKNTVFSILDTPFRLADDSTSVKNWVNNSNNAVENGEDGLLSKSSEMAVYYPHGLSTNLDGQNIMVPASHMALRTFAFNDQVSFPWFAPAGFQRGVVNNATSVGYLDAKEGEFEPVSLNEGQRDSYYLNKVNPISNFPGRGIAVFGQKTLNASASALDRVNVSRLIIYLREQLDDAVKPLLFEQNDRITRQNAFGIASRILDNLVAQRGLADFLVVCDDTNNTPARIDRNELHIDIAVQPIKSVEFIYIPIRIQNTLGQTGNS